VLIDAYVVSTRATVHITRREVAETRQWIDDVTNQAPGSLSFVCGALGLDVAATRAALDHAAIEREALPEKKRVPLASHPNAGSLSAAFGQGVGGPIGQQHS
jgi:hypothetical protein